MNLLSGSTWKGAKLRFGEAKPDFKERCFINCPHCWTVFHDSKLNMYIISRIALENKVAAEAPVPLSDGNDSDDSSGEAKERCVHIINCPHCWLSLMIRNYIISKGLL